MDKVRIGIVGLGNIGQHHFGYLSANKVGRAELVAVADAVPAKLEKYAAYKTFTDPEELFRSGLVDAVIIATPHYQHTALGIAALRQGLHIMIEKPISAHKADAERLIAAHRENPRLVFAGMFNLRAHPRYLKIRKLLLDGELGQFVRMSWIMTDWFRTEAYYASGGWRATWKGEGGGVLLNQCLHNLDAMQWLLGMPARVRGFCQLGRFHHIEVEDNVSAYLEYPDGATGTFVSSTGEAPGTNRFEIVGSRGKLVLESDKLSFTRNEVDMLEFSRTAKLGFSTPEMWRVEIPFGSCPNPHAVLTQNFVHAILDGEPLIAPGAQGIHSLELANAILYSSLLDKTVELPLDSAAYETTLNQLIANSTLEKKVVEVSNDDFAQGFRR
ncbi:MAG: oxidoreductase [Verrucomicrobia bacterium]|nr:MAG: oxidoreductase [Verrucomicrobiota bacterium]